MYSLIRTKSVLLIVTFLISAAACTEKKNDIVITISSDTISTGFMGNGVEWDPYDEAEAWGSTISESDWQKLFHRLDYMRPQYIRCMINSSYRYYNAQTGKYNKNRNIESISRLLQYCTERNITVIYGEYNPPTWDMKTDMKWIDMSVDYLNYLVNGLGFSCIKYFVIFNEPDGAWASTNGNYKLWKEMLLRFYDKMKTYSGLTGKVAFAGPDVVIDYKNPSSAYDAEGWVKQTVLELDNMVGVYDIHAYPGQAQVRSGEYANILAKYKQYIPKGKKILLGEAGYKYGREADSLLMAEYNRRAANHPLTKGTDSNMLVYDYFYGLDIPLLAMEVMNGGYSGMAVWMLDDAMHSKNDSGKTDDIKLWGMWNILGKEVFNMPGEEDIRPWFYTWSLMCRYFPAGCNILKTTISEDPMEGVFAVAGQQNGRLTVALVNVGNEDRRLTLNFPRSLNAVNIYQYEENHILENTDGFPVPVIESQNLEKKYQTVIKAQSFILFTQLRE
jgi:hypothetical protein